MRNSSVCSRILRDERGQTFLFVLTILFTLALLAGTSINIGQAVTRRLMLQIAADAGAYTGATEMARGMNTIAFLNRRIQESWALMSTATLAFTIPPCEASDLATESYGVASSSLGQLIRIVNAGYARRAVQEANRVTVYNTADMFPGESIEMGETHLESGIAPQRPLAHLVDLEEVPSGTRPDVPSLSPGYRSRTWLCWGDFPPVSMRSQSFSLWYRAVRSSMPISFVWTVTAPARRARVFDSFFGPDAIPEMTAAAVAKPVGGDIRRGRAKYITKIVPLRRIRAAVWDWKLGRMRTVHH